MTSDDFVGIEIELLGFDRFKKRLVEAQNLVKSADGKVYQIDFSKSFRGLKSQKQAIIRDIRDINDEIKKARRELKRTTDKEEIIRIKAKIEGLEMKKGELDLIRSKLQSAMEITPKLNLRAAATYGKQLWGAIGTSLETAGNAFTNLSNNPINTLLRGMAYSVGYGVTNTVSQGLSRSISRYDIMKTYPKMMAAMFGDTEETSIAAQKSIDKLKDSVLGLPTGLDEIVDSAQGYISILNDIDKGTDLAIAANNAFLASGATSAERYQGIIQLRDVLSGKDMTSREWNSLYSSMKLAFREIGNVLGYDDAGKLLNALQDGTVTSKQFTDALIEAGTGAGKLVEYADITKSKLSSSIENISNAFARLGENVISVIDEVLLATSGKTLNETISSISKTIDDYSTRIVQWIRDNPQIIKNAIDKIKQLDINGFIKSYVKGFKRSLDMIIRVGEWFSSRFDSGFVGWMLGFSLIGGRLITFFGQLVKATSPIGGILGMVKEIAVKGGGLGRGGLLGTIFSSIFGRFGASKSASEATKAASAASSIKGSLKAFFKNVIEIVGVATAVTAIIGEIVLVGKAVKELGKLGNEIDWTSATDTLFIVGGLMASFGGLAMALQGIAPDLLVASGMLGLITTVISGFAALDTWLIKKASENILSIVNNFKEVSKTLKTFTWNTASTRKIELLIQALGSIVASAFWNGFGVILGTLSKITANNLSDVMGKLETTLSSMARIAKSIEDIDVPSTASLDKIEKLIAWIGDFYALFDDDAFDLSILDQGEIGTQEADNLNKILESFQGSVESVKTIADTALGMIGSLDLLLGDEHGDKMATVRNGIHAIVYNIKEILYDFEDAYQELNGELSVDNMGLSNVLRGTFTGDTGIALDVSNAMEKLVGGFSDIITSVTGIVDSMSELASKADLLTNKDSGGKLGYAKNGVKQVVDTIKELLQYFNEQYSALNDELGGNTAGWRGFLGAFWSGDNGNSNRLSKKMGTFMSNFETVLTSIGNIMTSLSEMQGSFVNLEEVGGVRGITTRIESLINNLKTIVETFGKDTDVDFDQFKSDMDSLATAIDSVKASVGHLSEMTGGLTELGVGADGTFPLAQQISNLVAQLNASLGAVNEEGFTGRVLAFKFVMDELAKSLESFMGTNSSGLIGIEEELANIGEAIKLLGDEFENFFTTQDSRFSSAGKEWRSALLTGLDLPSLETTISSYLDSIFRSRGYWNNGYNTGLSYANGINAALGQIRTPTSVASSLRGLMSQYRASGGSIFRRRGTDTVPAMLTPGEFVMKRNAVKKFGVGFMSRLNSLDIDGAIKALSLRAGSNMRLGSSNVVNNRTTNNTNNARVTQNITTNNQNWSYRRANRWVRAF